MDTGGAYIASGSERVEDLVKTEMVHEFKNDKCNWFPRTDTVEHAKYDKRTPKLFKVEWKGNRRKDESYVFQRALEAWRNTNVKQPTCEYNRIKDQQSFVL